jgi:mannose/fructose-specific phosphotransferase system component IIA
VVDDRGERGDGGGPAAAAGGSAGLAPRGVLITHGDVGAALLRTAELVVGHATGLDALSNAGLSTPALASRLDELLAGEPPGRPIFLFVDLIGSSCAQACAELLRGRGARLFTGVNLPMVLAFIQYRESMSPGELADGILQRAHRGITVFPGLPPEAARQGGPEAGAG